MWQQIYQRKKFIHCFWLICFLFFSWSTTAFAINEGEPESNDADEPVPVYRFFNGLKVDTTGGGLTISNTDNSHSLTISGQLSLIHSGFGGAYNVDALGNGHAGKFTQY